MQNLLELISLINRNKTKSIDVIGNLPPRKSMVQQFYEKLSNGELSTDEEAAQYFYESSPRDRNYKTLKKRLTERLYNTAILTDANQARFNEAAKAYTACWKDFSIAKVLFHQYAHTNGAILMEKVLKQSLKYQFPELIVEICRVQRMFYASVKQNKKKFEYYNQLYTTYAEIVQADAIAEAYHCEGILNIYHGKGKKKELALEQAKTQLMELKKLAEQYDSYRLHLHYRVLDLTVAKENGEIIKAIQICEDALHFFRERPHYFLTGQKAFTSQLFILYWQTKQYEKGKVLLRFSRQFATPGTMDWSVYNHYQFLLGMHTSQYEAAAASLKTIIHHNNYKLLPSYERESWQLKLAYITFLYKLGKIKSIEQPKFRLGKFLNEVPMFAADKRARNIPILVIQILFLLLDKKHGKAIDRMEAIDAYCKRHLKKDDTYRSHCFIKMLLKIIEANFHPVAARRKAAPLVKKLTKVPFEVSGQVHEIEIIPYEELWELALESLDTKFYKADPKSKSV